MSSNRTSNDPTANAVFYCRPDGKIVECSYGYNFRCVYPDPRDLINCIGTRLDREQGTDYKMIMVRTDVTGYIAGKDNLADDVPIIQIAKLDSHRCGPLGIVRASIRLRNYYLRRHGSNFEQPVLVLGIDLAPGIGIRKDEGEIDIALQRQMNTIVNAGTDLYWSWCDKHGIDIIGNQSVDWPADLKPSTAR